MKYILIGTEGESTEPATIGSIVAALRQQSPRGYAHLEVVPLPLGGHHGHGDRLIKEFDKKVAEYIKNPNHCVEPTDEIIKFIACDHDRMEEHGINEQDFRTKVIASGATPIITKPKSEYFTARIFFGKDELAEKLNKGENLESLISKGIEAYNKTCDYDFQKLPHYSKKRYAAKNWFSTLFDRNPEFLEKAASLNIDTDADYYSELPLLIRQIIKDFE